MGTKQAYFKTKKEAIDAGGQNLREFIHPQKGTVMDVRADVPKVKGKRDFGDVLRTSAQKD
jgi:acetone carboxylase gamma subunit